MDYGLMEHFGSHGLGWLLWNLFFFLLGLLLGWLLWGRLVSGLKATIAEWEKKYASLQGDYDALKEKYAALEEELSRLKKDLEARNARIKVLENEKGQLHGDLLAVKSNLTKSENLLGAIKTDKEQVDGALKSAIEQNNAQTAEIEKLKAELAKANQGSGDDAKLKAQIAELRGQLDNSKIALKACQDKANSNTGISTGGGTTPVPVPTPTGGGDTGKGDMLQVIEGIGPKMEEALNKNGVKTFSTLGNSNKGNLDGILEKEGYNPGISDTQSWIDQARLANGEKWQELHDFQLDEGGGSIAKIDKYAKKLGIEGKIKHDTEPSSGGDTGKPELLQAIEGIGPKMEEALNNNGIKTFSTLGNSNKATLDGMLEKSGYNPGMSDTQSWIDQAKLASAGKWQDLHSFQLDEGGGSIAKIDKFKGKLGITIDSGGSTGGSTGGAPQNLQILEGIGPKMEAMLKAGGVTNYAALASKSPAELNGMIEKAGFNAKMSDTPAWIEQAKLASAKKWQALHDLQLDEGGGSIAKIDKYEKELGITLVHKEREEAKKPAAEPVKLSKEEKEAKASAAANKLKASMGTKIPTATADQKDDLKLISGVGPFIEEKLNKLGIYTFEQVSKFDTDLVDTITDAIQFFPGRIQRDDWVGQAGKLFKEKS